MRVRPEICRNIELVQIMIYLADEQELSFQKLNNRIYLSAIDEWFVKYRDHPAVNATRLMIREKHFNFTRPQKAALLIEDIKNNTRHELHDWATLADEFVRDSAFDSFFDSQQEYYSWIIKQIEAQDFDSWIDYIEHYFRGKPDEFHLIICPLNGNYGFNLDRDGKTISYTIRCEPMFDEQGNIRWDFDFFAKGIAHEYAHCFVNPVVESNRELLRDYREFFTAHHNMPDFYNVDYAVVNEYFVRAFAIRFMEEHTAVFQNFDIEAEYTRQRENFIYINRFVRELYEFEKDKLTFSEYYKKNINRILRSEE